MARKLRIEYPGAIYHVMNRGDHREDIFKDDEDRRRFLGTLGEACVKTDWRVHAYCLMVNHFHLVVETPRGDLVAGMRWFLGTYTSRYNHRHKLFGHLFGGRFKALVVDGSGNGYFLTVCDYVHLIRHAPSCWGRSSGCEIMVGAVTRNISRQRENGPYGCRWSVCWGRWVWPQIPSRVVRN